MRKDFFRRVVQHNFSIIHDNNPICLCCLFHIVGNQHNGNPIFPIQHVNRIHDFSSAAGVKHGSGFIQDNAIRSHGDNASNGNSLLLSTGKLTGSVFPIFVHLHSFQGIVNPFPNLLWRNAQIFRSKCHIFFDNSRYNLIIWILEHHSYMTPQGETLRLVFCIDAVHGHRTC